MKRYVTKSKKRGRKFSSSLKILFFTEGHFFFESHDITCLANSNAPTIATIETNYHIGACLVPQRLDGFYTRKKFYILFHIITFFLKKGGILFLPPPAGYSYFLLALLVVLTAFFAALVTFCGLLVTFCGLLVTSCGVLAACLSRRRERYGSTSSHAFPTDLKKSDAFRSSSRAAANGRPFSAPYSLMRVLARPLMRTGTLSPFQLARLALRDAARFASSAAVCLQAGQMTSRPTGMNFFPHFVQNFSVVIITFSFLPPSRHTHVFCFFSLFPWNKYIITRRGIYVN